MYGGSQGGIWNVNVMPIFFVKGSRLTWSLILIQDGIKVDKKSPFLPHPSPPHVWDSVFNRPDVAGAVLQSPRSLIDSLSDPLVQISSKHCQSQTGRAWELKFWENVHPTCVMCQVSHVTCHMWHVMCHLEKVVELVGGGSVINRAYPV